MRLPSSGPVVVYFPRMVYRPGPLAGLDRLLALRPTHELLPAWDPRGGERPRYFG